MTEEQSDAGHSYWSTMASRYFALRPPLRISPSDLDIYIGSVKPWTTAAPAPRVLVMGATPDFFHMPWPPDTDLLAVDRSATMLQGVWPGTPGQSLCGEWGGMDLPEASRDVVLCDGGLTFFASPEALQVVADNLAHIIAPGGVFIVRLYVDAEVRETPADIFAEFLNGEVANSSELKLRLWFALNAADGRGVRLHDVWRCYREAIPDPAAIARDIPWVEAEWRSMEAYQNAEEVYYFPSAELVTAVFTSRSGAFQRPDVVLPGGPCREHAKFLVFRRCR